MDCELCDKKDMTKVGWKIHMARMHKDSTVQEPDLAAISEESSTGNIGKYNGFDKKFSLKAVESVGWEASPANWKDCDFRSMTEDEFVRLLEQAERDKGRSMR